MQNKLANKHTALSVPSLIFNILVGFFSLFTLIVILIGVYHILIYIATSFWNPVFVSVLPAIVFVLMLGVIFLKQPVQNLLCLISIFFSAVILYLYAGAEYLSFLFLIVYVGAIAILFLFVIMLLHIKKSSRSSSSALSRIFAPLAVVVVCVCFGQNDFVGVAFEKYMTTNGALLDVTEPNTIASLHLYITSQFSDILSFSDILYRANAVLFFLTTLLLLTAMLGAIVLATSATDSIETPIISFNKNAVS